MNQALRLEAKQMGFKTQPVKHGKTIQLGSFKITLYQFGLIFTDAVIEANSKMQKLLDFLSDIS